MTQPPPYGQGQPEWQSQPGWQTPAPAPGQQLDDKPPFIKRKGVQIAGAVLAGLIVGAAVGGGGTAQTTVDTSTAEAATERAVAAEKKLAEAEEALAAAQAAPAAPEAEVPAPPPAPEPEPEPAPVDSGMSDGSFEVVEVQIGEDFAGDFEGTLRVTNTSDDEKTGIMTITLLKGGSVITSLQGAANEVGAGETATVQLISTDPYVDGPYETEFQVDGEF